MSKPLYKELGHHRMYNACTESIIHLRWGSSSMLLSSIVLLSGVNPLIGCLLFVVGAIAQYKGLMAWRDVIRCERNIKRMAKISKGYRKSSSKTSVDEGINFYKQGVKYE